MYIETGWRIITIGDGDLTFSLSLARKYALTSLTATVLDSESQLRDKYEDNAIDDLRSLGHRIEFNVDINHPDSFTSRLDAEFDLVIFQFPLVPNAGPAKPGKSFHHGEDSNLLNRILLANTLEHGFNYLLSAQGQGLCYITSKDVKPYCDWNITSLGRHADIPYLGHCLFSHQHYPGYNLRNVDRDKRVKATAATTYVWGRNTHSGVLRNLVLPIQKRNDFCDLCGAGPMLTEQDVEAHLQSRLHRRKQKYESQWQHYLLEKGKV